MRLIDADKINFEEVFAGASDFAKDLRSAAEGLIKRQPTAFDKEKVVEKIKDYRELIPEWALKEIVEIVNNEVGLNE